MKISIIGYGKMGQLIEKAALERKVEVVSTIDPFHPELSVSDLATCTANAHELIYRGLAGSGATLHNVELPLLYLGMSTAERKTRVTEVLDQMEITHRGNHFPQQLSGGQQQRVAVARAVVAQPRLILADEPTGNLDSSRGDEVMNLLSSLNENGTTIAMVTHSPAYAEHAHRIIHLFDGHVVTENIQEQYRV